MGCNLVVVFPNPSTVVTAVRCKEQSLKNVSGDLFSVKKCIPIIPYLVMQAFTAE